MHALADWVLAPARHAHDGHIGLRATPGGFGHDLARIEGTDLACGDRRTPITTLAAAAAFVGVPPAHHSGTYEPQTAWDGDAPLSLDAAEAAALAELFATAAGVLDAFRAECVAPTSITLWPEHLDVAFSAAEVNYGASPGDAGHDHGYWYVGPWNALDGAEPFWNEAFGASLPYGDGDAMTFLRRGRDLAAR